MVSKITKLSLVIPVFNEEKQLEEVLEMVFNTDYGIDTEFIIVDDKSSDNSWKILQKFRDKPGVKLFRQEKNLGKGAALHVGFTQAEGSLIAVQDADFEYDPGDLKALIQPIIENKADVVYGSRFLRTNPQVHRTIHYLANKILTIISNLTSGLYLSDMETCYKIFRREIIQNIPLESKRFGFEPEVTAKLAKLRIRIFELPISYYPRSILQGKKISWKDGFAALWFILKYNFKNIEFSKTNLPEKYHPQKQGYYI